MAKQKVAALSAGPKGKLHLVAVDREAAVLVRRGDEILAIGNECPHQGGALCDGWVDGDIVTCPLHGWEFDLRSGNCMTIPGERVSRWSVTVENGDVYLEESQP